MLNLNKVGSPLCKIVGGKYANMVVSVIDQFSNKDKKKAEDDSDDDNLIQDFKRLQIANDSKFQIVPDITQERQILYITGPSGSGKSTFTRKYIEELKKKRKDMPIYLFSAVSQDESLDSINPYRIVLDESLIEDPIGLEELSDSVCIFDDIDVIPDKKIREAVYKLLNMILECGRHTRTYCICTNHLPTNGRDTRRILHETQVFVYFPHSAGGRIKYFLQEYVGLDKKTIKYIRQQHTRWCAIFKNYPQVFLLEREVGLLTTLNDDD
jgi:Cdc6-like AAA superfamily ATPase